MYALLQNVLCQERLCQERDALQVMHLLLVDAPNHAVPINGMFHARLEPLRAFVSSRFRFFVPY